MLTRDLVKQIEVAADELIAAKNARVGYVFIFGDEKGRFCLAANVGTTKNASEFLAEALIRIQRSEATPTGEA